MGNLLSVKYSKIITTRDGDSKYLSQCFYKYEDRNINMFTTKEEDQYTEGAKFWEAFWTLWNNEPRFKTIIKNHYFQPAKRRTFNSGDGKQREKWGLQFNHWLPVKDGDTGKDESSGVMLCERNRRECFDSCLEQIEPFISKSCPQYLNPGVVPKNHRNEGGELEFCYD